jgi:hypothetical protein
LWPLSHTHARGELILCLAVAAAIVLLQAIVPLTVEQYFDSDQAVYGLMAKHLSEFRTFPLFFYGQNYMLGVQAWLAVPLFWIGGPTVAMLRTPVIAMNVAVALGYVWFLARQGLRPRYALAAALPVIAFTPAKAMEFGAVYGAGIEPFGYALLLWILRRRPFAFGAVLGFGTLHREFTFLALPALAVACWRDPAYRTPRSLALRGAGFAVIWLVVDLVKRNVNVYGPAGGQWAAGSVALGAQTFATWLSFDWGAYAARVWQMVTWGIPEMLGTRAYKILSYGIPANMEAGSVAAGAVLVVAALIAAGRTVRLWRRGEGRLSTDWRRFGIYLAALAVFNVLLYGLNGGIGVNDPPVLRYALFAPLLVVALFATYFARERRAPWCAAVAVLLAIWAASSVVDNARLVRVMKKEPPPRPHRVMANYLAERGIKYARAGYWDAYVITFLSKERVIVASTTTVRISAYQSEVDAHAADAVTLTRLPCEGETKIAAWCVSDPGER